MTETAALVSHSWISLHRTCSSYAALPQPAHLALLLVAEIATLGVSKTDRVLCLGRLHTKGAFWSRNKDIYNSRLVKSFRYICALVSWKKALNFPNADLTRVDLDWKLTGSRSRTLSVLQKRQTNVLLDFKYFSWASGLGAPLLL